MTTIVKKAAVLAMLLSTAFSQKLMPMPKYKYFNMPTPESGPCDVTKGPDGNPWVQEFFNNALVQIDLKTGKVNEYKIPFTLPVLNTSLPTFPFSGAPYLSCALLTAFDGRLWASNGARNQIIAMNVTTKQFEVFTPPNPLGNLEPLNDITAAPHAMYFTQTTGNVITRFDLKTHKFRDFTVPTPGAVPLGIYYATDGNIWFCELLGNKIGKLDTKTFKITEYPLPPLLAGPIVMRAQKGPWLYFCSGIGNSIGRINIYTGELRTYHIDTPLTLPVEDTLGADGNVWYVYILRNRLARLTPSTGEIVEYPLGGDIIKGPASVPFYLGDGIFGAPGRNIFFSETLKNRVVQYAIP